MGFIGATPPSPPSSDGMPEEDGDDTGIRISAAARAATCPASSQSIHAQPSLGQFHWEFMALSCSALFLH